MSKGQLFGDLLSKPQRETAGSDSSSRFNYQRNWAFAEMLRKHTKGEDYLVAFEYHDDVLFFDSSVDPKSVEFCQVKTTQSITTPKRLTTLTSRPAVKGSTTQKKNSVIGKLVLNLDGICKTFQISLLVVSNTFFEFSTVTVAADALDAKYRDKLLDKIASEFPDQDPNIIIKHLTFVVTEIPLSEMDTFVQGVALELFTSKFGEEFAYNVHSWVRLIQGEITRRNDHPSDEITSVSELIEKKCISKELIEHSLEKIAQLSSNAPDLGYVKAELKAAGWSFRQLIQLDKANATATRDYKDPNNQECRKLCEKIAEIICSLGDDYELNEIITEVHAKLLDSGITPDVYSDEMVIAALTILVIYEIS